MTSLMPDDGMASASWIDRAKAGFTVVVVVVDVVVDVVVEVDGVDDTVDVVDGVVLDRVVDDGVVDTVVVDTVVGGAVGVGGVVTVANRRKKSPSDAEGEKDGQKRILTWLDRGGRRRAAGPPIAAGRLAAALREEDREPLRHVENVDGRAAAAAAAQQEALRIRHGIGGGQGAGDAPGLAGQEIAGAGHVGREEGPFLLRVVDGLGLRMEWDGHDAGQVAGQVGGIRTRGGRGRGDDQSQRRPNLLDRNG